MKRKPFWKSRIMYVLQVALRLVGLATGGLKVSSLDLVIDQLDVIGFHAAGILDPIVDDGREPC